ncbi:hypothetical protein A1O3_07480 [Capronia epimyces CBS 606.96]|uniref:Uncharacterized protein n=1 Tax=Capronia epimyces CBS 606.96 TaxID=1182542 RepID=W9XV06_9EURO|nr:uncharacterized protein A1O3_07480 [Capronia epimyces CBS 606.96]EXJ81190.1 hypothetical protein A1O3_07480 [Capronia epimyces CBS 606.96]
MPASALTDQPNIHPVTLQPFSAAELEKYGYEKLREQVVAGAKGGSGTGGGGGGGGSSSSTGAGSGGGGNVGDSTATSKQTQEIHRIRDETAELLRQKLQDREAKIRQIEREMAEKEKTREVERKVFQKKFGAGKDL